MGMKFPGKGHKFFNVKTEVDGHVFASKKEAKRFGELKVLEKCGAISDLLIQEKYEFWYDGVKICDYFSDFSYIEDGDKIVEDVKSAFTRKNPVYRLKKKMMKAFHRIDIREV